MQFTKRSTFRHLPIISGLIEVNPAARRFLIFILANVVSWNCLAGPVLLLLALHIQMPIMWVGWLQAFMPMSMMLVLFTIPIVERFGAKKVMIISWLIRSLIVLISFSIPWALAKWGNHAAWCILTASTLGFCISRAVGAGGWFPWIHEIVKDDERGIYFSTESGITHVAIVMVTLVLAFFMADSVNLTKFLCVYGLGSFTGIISVILISRVPGGKQTTQKISFRHLHAGYNKTLNNRAFLQFILQGSLGAFFITWFTAAIIIYLRKILLLSDSHIVLATGLGSLGIAVTVRFWGRFADHVGNNQAMYLALFGHSVVVLLWLGIVPGASWSKYAVFPGMILTMIFCAAFWSVTHTGALALVNEDGKVGYTNLWLVSHSLALAVAPVIVGNIIDNLNMVDFRICFLVSGIGGLCCVAVNHRIQGHSCQANKQERVRQFFFQPIRVIANITWITVGLHESNKKN